MSVGTNPIFTQSPIIAVGQISTADTVRDNPSTGQVVVHTAGNDGTRIDLIRVQATVTTTAGMVRIFIDPGTGTSRLYCEIPVTATTPSATVKAFSSEFVPSEPILLPATYTIEATTHNAETFNVFLHGGNF